jgi:hypothetical protein
MISILIEPNTSFETNTSASKSFLFLLPLLSFDSRDLEILFSSLHFLIESRNNVKVDASNYTSRKQTLEKERESLSQAGKKMRTI